MIARLGENVSISTNELKTLVFRALEVRLVSMCRVLILPPDHTRLKTLRMDRFVKIFCELA